MVTETKDCEDQSIYPLVVIVLDQFYQGNNDRKSAIKVLLMIGLINQLVFVKCKTIKTTLHDPKIWRKPVCSSVRSTAGDAVNANKKLLLKIDPGSQFESEDSAKCFQCSQVVSAKLEESVAAAAARSHFNDEANKQKIDLTPDLNAAPSLVCRTQTLQFGEKAAHRGC